jgi:hypothetical protein
MIDLIDRHIGCDCNCGALMTQAPKGNDAGQDQKQTNKQFHLC